MRRGLRRSRLAVYLTVTAGVARDSPMRRGLRLDLHRAEISRKLPSRARLPDEKGIETVNDDFRAADASTRRARLPDEKGIETEVEELLTGRESNGHVARDSPMRRGLRHRLRCRSIEPLR